jgi:hypothetical protein
MSLILRARALADGLGIAAILAFDLIQAAGRAILVIWICSILVSAIAVA